MALNLPLGCGIPRSLLTVHELTPFTWPNLAHARKNSRHSGSQGPHRLALTISAASSSVPTTLNSSNNELFMILYSFCYLGAPRLCSPHLLSLEYPCIHHTFTWLDHTWVL